MESEKRQEVMVSAGATASHNHGYNSDAYPASNALDGNLASFSHTGGGPDDSWEMDLGETDSLTRLEIYNRDYYIGPLKGCTVRILDSQRQSLWSALLDKAEKKYVFDLGKTVTLYAEPAGIKIALSGNQEDLKASDWTDNTHTIQIDVSHSLTRRGVSAPVDQ